MKFMEIIDRYGEETLINLFGPLITDRRKERMKEIVDNRIGSVHVAIEEPADIHNALAIVRTAEAFGVANIHLIREHYNRRKGRKTMQGSNRWSHLHAYRSFRGFFSESTHFLIGAAPHAEQTLDDVPVDRPICLLFGNEKEGLSKEAIKACDFLYRIPMSGMAESFNLSVSAAISLHTLLKRKRDTMKQGGDLTSQEKKRELAYFCLQSVGPRHVKKILAKFRPPDVQGGYLRRNIYEGGDH